MHKFLMNFDGDTWSFIQDYSKRNGRTVAGSIRLLINDLREKELYGEGGLVALAEADQDVKHTYPNVGDIYLSRYQGKGRVVKVNKNLEQILVLFEKKNRVEQFWLDQYYEEMKK